MPQAIGNAILGEDTRTLEQHKADALQALADTRWEATQYCTYDGVRTQADSAISVVTGKVVAAQAGLVTFPMKFKLGSGEFRSWTLEDLLAFGGFIAAHIQTCFDLEEAAVAQINDEATDTPEAVWSIVQSVVFPT